MPPPTTVELLWGTRQRPKRGPKPALTLESIVAAAIALADAEGLANLSMQRLAERLGFTKMSLYRYVPGKAELTALMLDAGLGAPPDLPPVDPAAAEPWREALRVWCETIHERFRAHPWSLELVIGVRPIGPNEMAWMEAALRALADTGLTTAERLDTIVLLTGHARGLVHPVSAGDADALQEQVAAQFAELTDAAALRFPAAIAAFAEAGAAAGGDGALRFGIDRILDGLGAHIARRRAAAPPIVGS
ncbi:TetR/AcrR family transcriptional regulator [Nocardia bovistercoris]|uniref:TetR/AcrR family transcriptional regulator C-terminal domain-containing protein n=1 Tax=Nocardia bovistercoris TaxID=2785916 RepID=A0A931I8V5_9NOCA|nr:TetR/AcrR family transcriptional regulator [Nocardia bovistercoris]MBH0775995.1 TetR/AcrR family transcriptional regulator C-terminal domain-containing protein [Nocardia bovistercoris]